MPSPRPTLGLHDARRRVAEQSFRPSFAGRVGVELEWLPVSLDGSTPARTPDVIASAGALPAGSALTLEPGGQVELSSLPLHDIDAACAALALDARVLSSHLERAGLGLLGLGLAPGRLPRRCVDTPRYAAMETYFNADGPAGRTMMCGTAAVQINLDAGHAGDIEARWRRAHDLGPLLAATFANSPLANGGPSGWRSARLATWDAIDRGRAAPVGDHDDARRAWVQYALDAPVMLIRTPDRFTPILEPLTFREWVTRGHRLGSPTVDDLEYHLTTLFPPVRPRGWLELRMIDALPDPWWRVAVAVTTVLMDDDEAAALVQPALESTRGMWTDAARDGLEHPVLASAAQECFAVAIDALPRHSADALILGVVTEFYERYVSRGRCPADDRLHEWKEHGVTEPPPDRFLEQAWI